MTAVRRYLMSFPLAGLVLVLGVPILTSPTLAQAESQTLTLDSHENVDDGAAGPVMTSFSLTQGTEYTITVDGTFSVWERAEWDKPGGCGTPQSTPERSSPGVTNGPVSSDAEFLLAEPAWGGQDCNDPIPRHDGGPFQIDVGSGFSHVEPVGGEPSSPSSDHVYEYKVTGQGSPASFELVEDPTSDNYGMLTITVEGAPPPQPIGLVSHWMFDEGSGKSAADSITASSNDGTLRGNATFSSDVPPAVGSGRSLQLDGSGDHVEVADADSLDFGQNDPLTITMWAKRTSDSPAVYHLIGKRARCSAPPTDMNYQMGRDSRGYGFGSQTSELISTVPNLPLDQWVHLAATYNPSSPGVARIYYEGVEVGSLSGFAVGEENSAPLIIGGTVQVPGSTCINEPFPGLLDDVRIYNRTLGSSEVADLARGETETPPQCGDPGAVCGGADSEDIQGTSQDEFIYGGGGNDRIDGGGGNDVIVGGTGNDVIAGGSGKDKVTGGAGKDRILGDASGGSSAGAYRAYQSEGSADNLSGGAGNDTVLGQAGNDVLKGDGGGDVLRGGAGVNDFNGGPGEDTCVLNNKRDDTRSCEHMKRNFKRNFYPAKLPY